ncbi:ABC transporter ATP-binding protein [Reinekea blandensis]|uniref:ABC transporter related protein n=1 Tax=Reinekea blandensis MED297 TaxID=314283 RepID=A4BDV4_9GAMM|nr:ABC transporter ATP-binding protein [Reinekea blandensis]EAR09713.1 ABC transporter related protein [Reinekea blandensis MED297]
MTANLQRNVSETDDLLRLTDVHTHIGQYHILHGVSFRVPRNQVTMLLGRNGAGKTTTMRTIMGLWPAHSGQVHLKDRAIETLDTMTIARSGVHYVPENMGIFAGLTVEENVRLATRQNRFNQDRLTWVFGLFPALEKFWHWPAGQLSGGQKQMLAIARAIIEPCEILLVDEPSKGLAPSIIESLIRAFRELKDADTTILMVEQNFRMASTLGDHVAIMDDGCIVHESDMASFVADKDKQASLLGLSMEAHQ